jgi:hypothetical protein
VLQGLALADGGDTSSGKDIHHSFFSKVTSILGQYSVNIHLEEIREGSPPTLHEFTVPLVVQ